jgi:hypothetical protein
MVPWEGEIIISNQEKNFKRIVYIKKKWKKIKASKCWIIKIPKELKLLLLS